RLKPMLSVQAEGARGKFENMGAQMVREVASKTLIQKGMIRPVRAAPSLAQRPGGTRHAGCKTLRFRRRYGKLWILHHPQFTQGYDQVLPQPSHALPWYRYRRLVIPRDHHGQGVVVSNSLEFVSSHARFLS